MKDRNVIINTTNGTGAIKAAEGAAHVLIGAMINHTAVARMAAQLDRDVIILCAGTEGEFSADDICAAGAIATSLCKLGQVSAQCDLTLVAKSLYSDWREAGRIFRKPITTHGWWTWALKRTCSSASRRISPTWSPSIGTALSTFDAALLGRRLL